MWALDATWHLLELLSLCGGHKSSLERADHFFWPTSISQLDPSFVNNGDFTTSAGHTFWWIISSFPISMSYFYFLSLTLLFLLRLYLQTTLQQRYLQTNQVSSPQISRVHRDSHLRQLLQTMKKFPPSQPRPQSSFKVWAGMWQSCPMVTVTKSLPHYCSSCTPKDVALKVENSFLTLQQNGAFWVHVAAVFLLQRLWNGIFFPM